MSEAQSSEAKPRIEGVDSATLSARIDECDEHFRKHVDEVDYRNWEWFLWRANYKFAAGSPMVEVADDLFMAARCLHNRHTLHLDLRPAEMFLSRRLIPVELGLVSGQPTLTMELAATYGVPLMMLMARSASDELFNEAKLLTIYFRRGSCINHQDCAGFAALTYGGCLAAIGRGFDDEAALALNTFAEAREAFDTPPPEGVERMFRRYDQLCLALVCLLRGEWEELAGVLAQLADQYLEDLHVKLGDEEFSRPTTGQRYFDSSIAALLAIAALRNVAVDLPESGAIAAYRELVEVFTTAPEREIIEPELDLEARRLLAQMGMDPEQVRQQMMATASTTREALDEAQEEAHIAERQRQAQLSIQARIREREELERQQAEQAPEQKLESETQADVVEDVSGLAPDESGL